jgi:hypothetical protein
MDKHFGFDAVNEAYSKYQALAHSNPNPDPTPEIEAAALAFLSSVCDYYLQKNVGDFIEIKMADTWQR